MEDRLQNRHNPLSCSLRRKDLHSLNSLLAEWVIYEFSRWAGKQFLESFKLARLAVKFENSILGYIGLGNVNLNRADQSGNLDVGKTLATQGASGGEAAIAAANVINPTSSIPSIYETYYAWSCYNAVFCDFVKNCSEIWFCYDCFGSQNCFMSSNLRNKKYCIRNKQYTKEGYEVEMKKIFPLSAEKLAVLRKEYIEMKERIAIRPALYHVQVENSSGDLLFETKNCFHAYDSIKVEDSRYLYDAIEVKDSMDIYHVGIPAELTYECHAISNGYNCKFCHFVYDNSDLTYCDNCHNSRNLFGCVGLNQKKYCILNKQYSKEEYEVLVPKIIEQMKKMGEYGEFFPIQFSPFAYNQSRAQEYYPLTKEQATKKGIRWSSFEAPLPEVKKIIKAHEVPAQIDATSDDLLDFAIECEVSKRPFKITKPELNFYRKMGLPVPRRHPDQRYLDRMAQRNPRKIWKRNCQKCGITVESSFAPERPSKVYCQKCYLAAIY